MSNWNVPLEVPLEKEKWPLALNNPIAPPYGTRQDTPPPQIHNEHHETETTFKAAVFGFSDGLTTNITLILGVAVAHPLHSTIVLTGLASTFAGAASMACGEWLSAKAESDNHHAELQVERSHLQAIPQEEARHMNEDLLVLVVCAASFVLTRRATPSFICSRFLRHAATRVVYSV